MRPHQFHKKLKNIVGRKLPQGLENIIIESGFDSESTLATINPTTIKSIEEYVNENKDLLKGTTYESLIANNLEFKLKPGHKAIILSLPNQLKEYEKKSGKESKLNEEEGKLKQSIVNKIDHFARKILTELNVSEELIHEFQRENENYKCLFECPICSTKIKCVYKTYWLVSNLECHMKKHFRVVDSDLLEQTESESNSTVAENSMNVISYSVDQMDSLDKILSQ